MTEFTGERVIPGQVDADLWAEHLSRYRFAVNLAKSLAQPPAALDIGCGVGYGTAALAEIASSATGIDLAPDAISYAREHYNRPGLRFMAGSATSLPFPDASFDLITAYEVIEHLADGDQLLAEARRVLRPGGILLVSTPNTTYYAETRAETGPNPFHLHEYDYDAFVKAVSTAFSHSAVLVQNHTDAFAFYKPQTSRPLEGYIEATSGGFNDAHFFLAVCSARPLPSLNNFLYVPSAANVLREREHHIKLLNDEVRIARAERDTMMQVFEEQTAHVHELDQHLNEQAHLLAHQSRELEARSKWALQVDSELKEKIAELKTVVNALDAAEDTVVERTAWAQRVENELNASQERLNHVEASLEASRWVRLGWKLGFIPKSTMPATTTRPPRAPGPGLRILNGIVPFLISPFLIVLAAVSLALCDLVTFRRRRSAPKNIQPDTTAASIVIPNWNGRDLLEKYLPSVIAAAEQVPGSEVLVVDNGSEDGSADFVREHFPQVHLLPLETNLGFGGGSNAGFRAARHDVVVLLNSDMRVEPDFLQPLLDGFRDPQVFSVACQIFFSDPNKIREETGLTETWWQGGAIRVRHRTDPEIGGLFPCAYGGGGSCAFDRRKFLELGGFDELLAPFYMEDTDIGYLAWKRGWKNLYQPGSVVYHEHRGTIGKRFSATYIHGVLQKNFLLFTWKNMHDWRRLASHFAFTWLGAVFTWLAGDSPERGSFAGLMRATRQLPHALRARSRARELAVVSDTDALRRPLGGYFRDAFDTIPEKPDRLRVLFASPYPIYPPVHGGAVFMYQTARELARLCELHAVVMLEEAREREAHRPFEEMCASTDYLLRSDHKQKALASTEPHAFREFRSADFAWMIHRVIYTHQIDVLQLEYAVLGQYAGQFRRIPSILFEHDVYFQAIARRLPFMRSPIEKLQARWEYLRALRYELRMLPKVDRIQVCSRDNAEYLESFLPELRGRIDDGYRAGIDTSQYAFTTTGRTPLTILFLGSFRHLPNQEALHWFVGRVLPLILREEPAARFVVIGSEPPPQHSLHPAESIDLIGFVPDIREPLAQYSVFVCPILSGSGVRVKLLEAFAAGIPVVSTRLGAEGLAEKDGEICALADDPETFARQVLHLLRDPEKAAAMATRAREEVVAKRDIRSMTERLVNCYRSEVVRLRSE